MTTNPSMDSSKCRQKFEKWAISQGISTDYTRFHDGYAKPFVNVAWDAYKEAWNTRANDGMSDLTDGEIWSLFYTMHNECNNGDPSKNKIGTAAAYREWMKENNK